LKRGGEQSKGWEDSVIVGGQRCLDQGRRGEQKSEEEGKMVGEAGREKSEFPGVREAFWDGREGGSELEGGVREKEGGKGSGWCRGWGEDGVLGK